MDNKPDDKVEPMSRMMREGETLTIVRKDHRIIFESKDEPNTTVAPVIGVLLEFQDVVRVSCHSYPNVRRCILRHVWISSVTGESKSALEFEHFLLYLETCAPGQEVRVLKMP